ncbi:hypothetical protein BJ875DRAFT_487493 [Amylocarpus encephaloides]|uniref:FAD/NAD(P)-binding domain-containing protein n=1 Tax=Amylocarpus encephaloides TaxID=45428 RepID=A0A9P7YBY6_9HELO|nr:hypothetical protein BJ875DRAFT_487493 [Amylocarpus encephaloides]
MDLVEHTAPQPSQSGHTSIFDVLLLGGGHAGLSAALTLYRHQHDMVVFDSGQPRNKWRTPTHALSGWENRPADDFCAVTRAQLEQTGFIRFVDQLVETISRDEASLFVLHCSDGSQWKGRKLLLSMGADIVFPEIEGYKDHFPQKMQVSLASVHAGVLCLLISGCSFHCLFTFGLEHRGSASAGILSMGYAANPFHASILIEDARKFAEIITVYTNGDVVLANKIQDTGVPDILFDHRKIRRLGSARDGPGITIDFEEGETKLEDFIVHQPPTRVNPAIVEQLGLKLDARGDIMTTPPFYETNVEGVFAAGDCASPFKMIANAMLMGANAGAGIARQLPRSITGNRVDQSSAHGKECN